MNQQTISTYSTPKISINSSFPKEASKTQRTYGDDAGSHSSKELTVNFKSFKVKPTPPIRTSSLKRNSHFQTLQKTISPITSVNYYKNRFLSLPRNFPIKTELLTSNISKLTINHQATGKTRLNEAIDLIEKINKSFYKIPSSYSEETERERNVFLENALKELYGMNSLLIRKHDSNGESYFSTDFSEVYLKSVLYKLSSMYHMSSEIEDDARKSAALLKCYHKEYMDTHPKKPLTTEEREAMYLPPPPEEWLE